MRRRKELGRKLKDEREGKKREVCLRVTWGSVAEL